MERRYPVIVRRFCLRPESGGKGAFVGGNGIIRDLEFRRPVQCSILSERRVTVPYGMAGGEPGKCGRNLWVRTMPDGKELIVNLGGKNSAPFSTGDRIVVRPFRPFTDSLPNADSRLYILLPCRSRRLEEEGMEARRTASKVLDWPTSPPLPWPGPTARWLSCLKWRAPTRRVKWWGFVQIYFFFWLFSSSSCIMSVIQSKLLTFRPSLTETAWLT